MRYLKLAMIATLGSMVFAAEGVADVTAAEPAADAVKKSIVPAKYAGKYKDGGSDELAEFIKTQCTGKDGFEFPAFFSLCRKNGVDEAKVAHYEGIVTRKEHGGEGRARMTLRNMLAGKARKDGKLIALNDTEVAIALKKPAVSGAAAKAQEAAAANESPVTDADVAETDSTEATVADEGGTEE